VLNKLVDILPEAKLTLKIYTGLLKHHQLFAFDCVKVLKPNKLLIA